MSIASIHLNDWNIAYSSYVDTLHVYQKKYNQHPKDKLVTKESDSCYIIFDTDEHLLLFEMKNASEQFGDIDKLDKRSIISRVTGYVNHVR